MVESQIIPAGTKTLDEHVSVIIGCKERVKLAIFDYVDAIQSAHKDLETTQRYIEIDTDCQRQLVDLI